MVEKEDQDLPLIQTVFESPDRSKLFLNSDNGVLRMLFASVSKSKKLDWVVDGDDCYLVGSSDQISQAETLFAERLRLLQKLGGKK